MTTALSMTPTTSSGPLVFEHSEKNWGFEKRLEVRIVLFQILSGIILGEKVREGGVLRVAPIYIFQSLPGRAIIILLTHLFIYRLVIYMTENYNSLAETKKQIKTDILLQ